MLLSCLKSDEFTTSVYLQSQASHNIMYEQELRSRNHHPSNTLSSSSMINDRSMTMNTATSINTPSSTTSTSSNSSSSLSYYIPVDAYDQNANYQDEHLYYALQMQNNTSNGMGIENSMTNSHIKADNNMKSSLYKTELCKRFVQYGNCRYGMKCQFAHGMGELRQVLRHPKYKTTRCKSFWGTGQCPYGIRCRFIHEEGDYYCYNSNQSIDYSITSHEMQDLANQMHMMSVDSNKTISRDNNNASNDDDANNVCNQSNQFTDRLILDRSIHTVSSPASTITNLISPASPLSSLSSYLDDNDHENDHENDQYNENNKSTLSRSSSASVLTKEKIFCADYKLWEMNNKDTEKYSKAFTLKNYNDNPAADEDTSPESSITSNTEDKSSPYATSNNLESFLLDVSLSNLSLSTSSVILSKEEDNDLLFGVKDIAGDIQLGEQYEKKESTTNYLFQHNTDNNAVLEPCNLPLPLDNQKIGSGNNGRLRIFQAFTGVRE